MKFSKTVKSFILVIGCLYLQTSVCWGLSAKSQLLPDKETFYFADVDDWVVVEDKYESESESFLRQKLKRYGFNADLAGADIEFVYTKRNETAGVNSSGMVVNLARNFDQLNRLSLLTITTEDWSHGIETFSLNSKRSYFANCDPILFHEFFHDLYFSDKLTSAQREHFWKLLLGNSEVIRFICELYGRDAFKRLLSSFSEYEKHPSTHTAYSEYFSRFAALFWRIYIKRLLYIQHLCETESEEIPERDELYFFDGNPLEMPSELVDYFYNSVKLADPALLKFRDGKLNIFLKQTFSSECILVESAL